MQWGQVRSAGEVPVTAPAAVAIVLLSDVAFLVPFEQVALLVTFLSSRIQLCAVCSPRAPFAYLLLFAALLKQQLKVKREF